MTNRHTIPIVSKILDNHADFESVVDNLLEDWCEGYLLADLDKDSLTTILAPIISAAFAVKHYGLSINTPSITFAGAEIPESIDYGYWIDQLIPYLLGVHRDESIKIDISLLGVNLCPSTTGLLPEGLFTPVSCYPITLRQFVSDHQIPAPDLMIFFQPGFEQHWESWLEDEGDAFRTLLDSGTTIIMGGYDKAESEIDRTILSMHGFDATQLIPNPYSVVVSDVDSPITNYYSQYMFSLNPTGRHMKKTPDKKLVNEVVQNYSATVITPEMLSSIYMDTMYSK